MLHELTTDGYCRAVLRMAAFTAAHGLAIIGSILWP